MNDRADQIKALASETRIEILRLLVDPARHFGHQESADPERTGVCIQLIAEKLGISQPTTSRHVDLLKRAGFIAVRRHQKWSYCSRDEARLADYLDWLGGLLDIRAPDTRQRRPAPENEKPST